MKRSAPDKRAALLLALALLPAAVPADDVPAVKPVFVVHTAAGEDLRGAVGEIGTGWSVRLGGKDGKVVAGSEIVTVRRADVPLPQFPSGSQLLLANGDRVPVKSVRLDGERLLLRHPHLGDGAEVAVPLGAAAVVWLQAPATADDPEALRRRLAAAARPRDRVILRNGDLLDGVLTALDPRKVTVEVNGKPVEVATATVAAIALSSELADTARPRGVYARAVLLGDRDSRGTRVSLRSATCRDGATLEGEALTGARLAVPLEQLAALDLYGGRAVYLSDLKPVRYEHRPFFAARWPYVNDGSVAGRDLRLAGGAFDKGLGLHSFSRLTYALTGEFKRFEALVGLDDFSGRSGSARVRVLADGKPLDLGPPRELTAGGGPLAVRVPLPRAKELTLEVDYGARGDVQDHVNWADARLIR